MSSSPSLPYPRPLPERARQAQHLRLKRDSFSFFYFFPCYDRFTKHSAPSNRQRCRTHSIACNRPCPSVSRCLQRYCKAHRQYDETGVCPKRSCQEGKRRPDVFPAMLPRFDRHCSGGEKKWDHSGRMTKTCRLPPTHVHCYECVPTQPSLREGFAIRQMKMN